MGMLTRLLAPTGTRGLAYPSPELIAVLRGGGMISAAGVTVSEKSALGYAAVLAAVRVLSESVAGLPAILYRREGRSRQRATAHRLYALLHDGPNRRMTAFEFFELGMSHLTTWGNFYAEIERDRSGRILALWPLRPDRMEVGGEEERLIYRYQAASGAVRLYEEDVLHVRGMGGDGIVGYSLIRLAQEAIGLGMAAERFGSAVFLNGAAPGIVLRHPGTLSPVAHQNLEDSWNDAHAGLENAYKPAILEEGMSIEKMGLPPEDAQFLETRRFQVEEIARIYRVPLHLLQDLERATFSNIEHQSLDFVVHTLRPWLVRWEQSLVRQLLTEEERQQYYVEFLVDALLRGDTQTRYQAYGVGRQWGWLSANDVRRLENMDVIQGGDEYLTPLNMGDARQGGGEAERGGRRDAGTQRGKGEERRAATGRRRVMEGYRPALQDVMQRILNREANDLMNAARRIFGKRGVVEWESWLDEFYEEHVKFMRDYLAPVFGGYATLVVGELEEETGATARAEDVQSFLAPYTASRAGIYGWRHKARVKEAAQAAQAVGEDPQAAVEAEVKRLQGEEAERFAQDESVRLGNALARAILPLLGVAVLRWVAYGDSCEYCQSLDGRTVGADGWFINDGETLMGEAGGEYRPGGKVGHPPLHGGCDCMIIAG